MRGTLPELGRLPLVDTLPPEVLLVLVLALPVVRR
jgi:hypothetical protein